MTDCVEKIEPNMEVANVAAISPATFRINLGIVSLTL
jgi:hypothetical protein